MAEGASTAFLGHRELITFAGFVVPGFIGMLSYSLFQPSYSVKLKDAFLEAIAFGIVNLSLLWPLVSYIANTALNIEGWVQGSVIYVLSILVFLIAPFIWALILHRGLRWFENKGWIQRRERTAWDSFFVRKLPAKIIVHLKDGALLGGQFGDQSYASLSPDPGHLYLERLWRLDENGVFIEALGESVGVILRPEDYEFVELLEP